MRSGAAPASVIDGRSCSSAPMAPVSRPPPSAATSRSRFGAILRSTTSCCGARDTRSWSALAIPVAMAYWFAPALVALNGLGPVAAMKTSFLGCLKNILPFLLYGLVAMLAGLLAVIPLGLGWFVLGPVLAASMYAAYRDIYYA